MSNIPALPGKQMISALKKSGFDVARIKGSHHFLIHSDGRILSLQVLSALLIVGLGGKGTSPDAIAILALG